jgi:precorrin-6A/cobalt-precorrin-6A reductase
MPMIDNQGSDMMPTRPVKVLLLGGTTEAAALAQALAGAGTGAIYSYAGRTSRPVALPLPTRIGGFGGVAGLVAFLAAEGITHVVDATHPFAAQMSGNAVAACTIARIPLIALERPAWVATDGDLWTPVPDTEAAVSVLPDEPWTVFLAIGRQSLDVFAAKPQHRYILRLVDAPEGPLPLPLATVLVARGPFDVAGDTALMQSHGVDLIIAKNAGGTGAEAKLIAARHLGLPVILIDRPTLPPRLVAPTVPEVIDWLHQTPADLGV